MKAYPIKPEVKTRIWMNLAAALEIAALRKRLREAERVLRHVANDDLWASGIWLAKGYFERKRKRKLYDSRNIS